MGMGVALHPFQSRRNDHLCDTVIGSWRSQRIANRCGVRCSDVQFVVHTIRLSDKAYVELLCSSESQFEKAFRRASHIKEMENLLSVIKDTEWSYICSLSDTAFYERVRELIARERERRDKAEAYANKQRAEEQAQEEKCLKELCGRYGIGESDLERMAQQYGSRNVVLNKLQLADTIAGEYRHRLPVIAHLDSPDTLKKLVKDLKQH